MISPVDGGCFSTERVAWLEVSVMATGDDGGMEMESVDLGKKSNWVKEGSGSCSFGWPILVGCLYRKEIPGTTSCRKYGILEKGASKHGSSGQEV